ncbi:efflux RND transporter permease subunit [Paraliomyxa miuraensis]|uniref:efflux RND transporter permease subunit n=1 Tax=Paraliomyxa miuraensis TaxID=376150 RepID=UPI00225A7F31|nr:efflux RND transporter permease subunit [Paraliomyxa miuraensis]MCX4239830.1 efflux RND transporter permease subunit [Paraliomyxa miuraensis]
MFDRIIRLSVANPVFVNLLFFLVVAAGLRAAMSLPREEFPEISLDRVMVNVPYPGATAATVEELIIRPIEDEIESVNNIKEYSAFVNEGSGTLTIIFNEGTDLQAARSEVEKAVSSVQNMPEDAETPVVRELTLELPVVSVALTGDNGATLVADRMADALRDLPGVATVNVSGVAERKIFVDLDEQKLRTLGISPAQIRQAIRSAEANLPAGTVEQQGQDIFVKTEQRLQSAADVARIPIMPGSPLRIGDVSETREVADEAETLYWVDGEPCVKLTVGREETADPLEIREHVLEVLPTLQAELPAGMEIRFAEDFTATIRDRLHTVWVNAAGGAVLVLLVLLVMSGLRQALLAIAGMPVSYLAATLLMDQTDLTINVVSTFGLLIATGIIVDDAIVVIENVQRHLEMGKSRVQATLDGAKEVILPVTVAVLTTILAFVPLTMVGGTMGRVMKILPLVVIFCLIGSMFEAIFILPGHIADYATEDAKDGYTARLARRMQAVYRPLLRACIRHRFLTVVLVIAAFVGVGRLASTMPLQIGAPGKPFQLGVHYEVSPGLARELTQAEGEAIDRLVRRELGEEHIRLTSLRVGSILDDETGVLSVGANMGQLRWQFEMSDELVARYPAMVRALRKSLLTNPELSRSAVKEVQAGPPAGAAVTANVRGRDIDRINAAIEDLKVFLYEQPGARDIRDNYGSGKETFQVKVDQDRAALYGLTELDVAQAVRTAVDGLVAAEVSIDEEPVEIVVRYAEGRSRDRSGLKNLVVTGASGRAVRLDQVAEVVRTREVGYIRREEGLRQVSVLADTDQDVLPPFEAAQRIAAHWDAELASRYPGLQLTFGGQADELTESLRDLPGAFGLAVLMIYLVLALQFRSYLQPFIILSAVPFGLMGAVLGLYVMSFDLSLMALFGIVALVGIVVNDSLVMVDFINKKRQDEGLPLWTAVEVGAIERLRPILSTTLTTCLGLLPLAIGLGGRDDVLAPMAVSISAGLGFATGLVLLVVPAAYLVFEDVRGLGQRLMGRKGKPGSGSSNRSHGFDDAG